MKLDNRGRIRTQDQTTKNLSTELKGPDGSGSPSAKSQYVPPRANQVEGQSDTKPDKFLSRLMNQMFRADGIAAKAVLIGAGAPAVITGCATAQIAAPVDTTPQLPAVPDSFDPGRLQDYPLFQKFWSSDQPNDGTSHAGLDQVSVTGAEAMVQYARAHTITGQARQDTQPSGAETELVAHILEHPYYGGFFGQEARTAVAQKFGIPVETVQAPSSAAAPIDAGSISLPGKVTTHETLRGPLVETLGAMMSEEYQARQAYFEDPSVSDDEKGLRVLGLLRDYADAVSSYGQLNTTEEAARNLLDAFEQLPFAHVHGAQDYNGAGWGAAQSIVLGIDPNKFETDFPNATGTVPTTGLSMNGNMADPMRFVDNYREASGEPRAAEKYENSTPLGYMIGEEAGHKKVSYTFEEAKPFSTSGNNWAKVLFPERPDLLQLQPKPNFEFPIDAVDGFGFAIHYQPGDKLNVVHTESGQPLKAEVVIHEEDGQAKYWSAKFVDANGQEVAPSQVTGVLQSPSGETRGDGRAVGKLGMGWWGFCAENTAQRVVKARFQIPELDAEIVKVRASNGQIVEFPRAQAQKVLDADWEDVGGMTEYSGFRFHGNPQTTRLTTGETVKGRVQGLDLIPGPETRRTGEDFITVLNTKDAPFLGTIRVEGEDGSTKTLDLRHVKQITRESSGRVTVELDRYPSRVQGKLLTEVDFSAAKTKNGTKVLANSPEAPVKGEFQIDLGNGQTKNVPVSQVASISGEVANDMRFSHFLGFVSRMDGVYGTDSALGDNISNGVDWVNTLERVESKTAARPDWAGKDKLVGIKGPLSREPGDKIVYARGLYKNNPEAADMYSTFKGWVQVNEMGRVINEGFIEGAPDFAWAPSGPLDWSVTANTFNPHVPSDLRIKLFVNGIQDEAKLESMAKRLNFPENWRELRVNQ